MCGRREWGGREETEREEREGEREERRSERREKSAWGRGDCGCGAADMLTTGTDAWGADGQRKRGKREERREWEGQGERGERRVERGKS